jgi:predicted deacylase
MSEPDDSESDQRRGEGGGQRRRKAPAKRTASGNGRKPSVNPAQLAQRAVSELADLIGHEVEGIVSLHRTDDGWAVGVEVLETARIPDTADVLAEYEVDADGRGHLLGYQRVRRYTRGSTREDR